MRVWSLFDCWEMCELYFFFFINIPLLDKTNITSTIKTANIAGITNLV